MYNKLLLPLDRLEDSENVIPLIENEIGNETQVILLNVLRPVKTQVVGGQTLLGSQREESERLEALSYLRSVISHRGSQDNWTGETIISKSPAEGIVDFASREGVDLIAMYEHQRGSLTRLIKGGTAKGVRRHASTEVRVFTTQDLESRASITGVSF